MFDPLFDAIAGVLAWFYDLTGSYAISISLLTFAIMLVFTPLTFKGTRSMMRMQEIQPEIKRIQAKYRNDRQAMNQEMMQLYQARGVNPLGGCLPTLVQLPVFIVLYRVLVNLTETTTDGCNEGVERCFAPKNLSEGSTLYQDLADGSGKMLSFGIDLSRSANDVLRADFIESLPYLALVAVTFVLSWYQQRQMKSRRGAQAAAAANPQMELMMKILPFMLPVFAFIVQAALAVYFIASAVYRIGQQAVIHATMKPVVPAADGVVEADVVPEDEPAPKEIANNRSRKALQADEDRRAARELRSAQRGKNASPERRGQSRRRSGERGRSGSKDDSGTDKGTTGPIQSRRTSGDGRTRKRKK